MTERDWRIFREDFNIAYKGSGTNSAMPIRNWEEANLPKELMKVLAPPPPSLFVYVNNGEMFYPLCKDSILYMLQKLELVKVPGHPPQPTCR